jgi:hypothetical protein
VLDNNKEGGKLIKQWTEYKYLGMKIRRQGTHDSKTNERIKLGHYAISTLKCTMEQECYKRKEKLHL